MSKKALVVDNDFFFVEFLAEILQKRGYEVFKAYDGKEGITCLKEKIVDVLFVDMVMPKIDGRQMIQYTRQQLPNARFPIIAISGTLIEQIENIHKFGADFYIAKGPIGTMSGHINRFMDRLEKLSFPFLDHTEILEPVKLYPRQSTAELIDVMDFQEAILKCIGVGIFIADKDAAIIRVNDQGLEIIQKTIGEVLNCHVTTIFPPAEKSKVVNELRKIVRHRELNQIVFSVSIDCKKIRNTVSLLNVNNEIVGWIIVMEEMSRWEEQA
ncbi:MAG: response regulator [Deltaproteobacteria bacterium]|nr:response regulator [Deltaproteobacteria bacterium]